VLLFALLLAVGLMGHNTLALLQCVPFAHTSSFRSRETGRESRETRFGRGLLPPRLVITFRTICKIFDAYFTRSSFSHLIFSVPHCKSLLQLVFAPGMILQALWTFPRGFGVVFITLSGIITPIVTPTFPSIAGVPCTDVTSWKTSRRSWKFRRLPRSVRRVCPRRHP